MENYLVTIISNPGALGAFSFRLFSALFKDAIKGKLSTPRAFFHHDVERTIQCSIALESPAEPNATHKESMTRLIHDIASRIYLTDSTDMNGVSPEDRKDDSVQSRLNVIFRPLRDVNAIKLVVMDLDSTLIQNEVIDEIAAIAGPAVEAKVKAITDASMRGELNFESSLRERVGLFSGLKCAELWKLVQARVTLTPGALEFCQFCNDAGIVLAICSGGFVPMIRYIQGLLSIGHGFGNELDVEYIDGEARLNGKINGPVFSGEQKAQALHSLATLLSIPLCQVMAIGDGANDIPMLKASGMGIAFNAKPLVKQVAPYSIDCPSMLPLKCLLSRPHYD